MQENAGAAALDLSAVLAEIEGVIQHGATLDHP